MGKRKWVLFVTVLLVCLFISSPEAILASDGTSVIYDGYTYDYFRNVKESPAAFTLESVIDESNLQGMALMGIDDVCTSEDGRIFLVDRQSCRVHILDEEGGLLKSIKVIKSADGKIVLNEDGSQLILQGPEGVFYHEKKKELYIADTAGEQIIVLDGEDYSFIRKIVRPDNMTGTTSFKPSKIAVDNADRIYVVVQSSYEGIVELNEDGSFSRYFGVNSPVVNLVDYFWKSIASDEQKAKMSKTYAPSFNNIAIDGEGFVMAVTYDSAAEDMVFRLNSSGKNVLREEGSTHVIGDIYYMDNNGQSKFVDLAVTKYGSYALVDKQRGRIFLYDFDGNLLSVFGSTGNVKGEFQMPSGIAWLGDKLIVSDSTLKRAYILAPTDFGYAALHASEAYYYGEWDTALSYFEEAARLNANYEIAYIGIGKNYLMKDDYETAMYYFKLGNDRTFYSKAYNGYRNQKMKDNFGIIAILVVAVIGLVVYTEIRYYKKKGGTE